MAEQQTTINKAIWGTILGGVSCGAGLLVGAMGLVDVKDVITATGQQPEVVSAWWRIIIAIVSVVAAAGATGGVVYQVRNVPIPVKDEKDK
jgi:ABC-type branched-subunit amino acid transport system permease subunit